MAVNRKSKCRKNEETNRGMQLEEGEPPLCKGRWRPGGQTEGLMGLNNRHSWFAEISAPNNPPVKNQRFLPAPFTQGGLTQLANRTCTLMRYTRIRGLYPLNDTHRLHRWVCFMGDWAFAALRRDQGTRGPNWLWSPKAGSPSQAAMVWGIWTFSTVWPLNTSPPWP